MLSKIMKVRNSSLSLTSLKINNFSLHKLTKFNFSVSDEKNLNETHRYICSFTGKKFDKFDKFEDSLLVDKKLLGRPAGDTQTYAVYNSKMGNKIYKVVLLQLLMAIPVVIFSCLMLKWLRLEVIRRLLLEAENLNDDSQRKNKNGNKNGNKSKTNKYIVLYFSLFVLSLAMLEVLRRNNLYKVWNYIKTVELSNDLQSLLITTFTNKKLVTPIKDVYLYFNFSSPYISHQTFSKVEDTLVVGVKEQVLILPLENSVVQSKDLLSICLRGYKLKYRDI